MSLCGIQYVPSFSELNSNLRSNAHSKYHMCTFSAIDCGGYYLNDLLLAKSCRNRIRF